jgi:hypothetical protein
MTVSGRGVPVPIVELTADRSLRIGNLEYNVKFGGRSLQDAKTLEAVKEFVKKCLETDFLSFNKDVKRVDFDGDGVKVNRNVQTSSYSNTEVTNRLGSVQRAAILAGIIKGPSQFSLERKAEGYRFKVEYCDNRDKARLTTVEGIFEDVVTSYAQEYGNAADLLDDLRVLFLEDSRFESLDEDVKKRLYSLAEEARFQTEVKDIVIRKGQKGRVERLARRLTALVEIEEVEVEIPSHGTMSQSMGHLDGEEFVRGHSVIAEVQKEEILEENVANHGHVIFESEGGLASRVVLSRSARTVKKQQILDKSRADIIERLDCEGDPCLIAHTDAAGDIDYYEYQRVDMTAMDRSGIKGVFTKAISLFKRAAIRDDEGAYLREKEQSLRYIWAVPTRPPRNGSEVRRVCEMAVKWDDDRRECYIEREIGDKTIREYRPIKFEFTCSMVAKWFKGSLKDTRAVNREEYFRLLHSVPYKALLGLSPAENTAIVEGLYGTGPGIPSEIGRLNALKKLYRLSLLKRPKTEELHKLQMLLVGLKVNLTNEDFGGDILTSLCRSCNDDELNALLVEYMKWQPQLLINAPDGLLGRFNTKLSEVIANFSADFLMDFSDSSRWDLTAEQKDAYGEALLGRQPGCLSAAIIWLMESGTIVKPQKYDRAEDPGKEFLFMQYGAELANIALGVECKSGKDRTATVLALKCAAEEFFMTKNRAYDPRCPADHQDHKDFQPLFRKYIIKFGVPIGYMTMGRKALKSATSPSFAYFSGDVRLYEAEAPGLILESGA